MHTAELGENRWVSVDDRLPEYGIDVQVYNSDTKEQMVGFRSPKHGTKQFQYASSAWGGILCEPTHWMPLPACPTPNK